MTEGNWHNDLKLGWRAAGCMWVLAVKWEGRWRLSCETEIALMKGVTVTLHQLNI